MSFETKYSFLGILTSNWKAVPVGSATYDLGDATAGGTDSIIRTTVTENPDQLRATSIVKRYKRRQGEYKGRDPKFTHVELKEGDERVVKVPAGPRGARVLFRAAK